MEENFLYWPLRYSLLAYSISFIWAIKAGVLQYQSAKCQHILVKFLRAFHDFFFTGVSSMAGFLCIYILYFLFHIKGYSHISMLFAHPFGLIALLLIGVLGVSGQLSYFLLFSKKDLK